MGDFESQQGQRVLMWQVDLSVHSKTKWCSWELQKKARRFDLEMRSFCQMSFQGQEWTVKINLDNIYNFFSTFFKFYFWLMKTIWNSKRENLVLKVNIVMDDRMWITIFWCSSQRLRTSKQSPNFVALRQFSHVTSVFDTGRGDHLHNYKHFNKWPMVSFFCWGQTG